MTEHFTLNEFVFSQTAIDKKIDNKPSDEVLKQLLFTAAGLERIRWALGFPIKILSGYRSEALNTAIGGVVNSQHIKGEAVDFICRMIGPPQVIVFSLKSKVRILGIDQLICEPDWVHASFTVTPRYEILKRVKDKYVQF